MSIKLGLIVFIFHTKQCLAQGASQSGSKIFWAPIRAHYLNAGEKAKSNKSKLEQSKQKQNIIVHLIKLWNNYKNINWGFVKCKISFVGVDTNVQIEVIA